MKKKPLALKVWDFINNDHPTFDGLCMKYV